MLTASDAAPDRILFLGSSSTFMRGLPKKIVEMVQTHEDHPAVDHHLIGQGADLTYVYLRDGFRAQRGWPEDFSGSILDHIAGSDYRWISLQVTSLQDPEWEAAIPAYGAAARAAGSRLLLYETDWDHDGEDALSGSRVLPYARALRSDGTDVAIVPCRTAWQRFRREHPDIPLINGYRQEDGSIEWDPHHPGALGAYLNQLCFYAVITGTDPTGRVGQDLGGVSARLVLPEAGVHRVDKDNFPAHRQYLALDDDLATAMQIIAWETVQAVDASLREGDPE